MLQTSSFRQFLILLYKGAILRKRHYIFTFFEIVIPVLLSCIGPIIYSENCYPSNYDQYRAPRVQNATLYEPFDPYKLSVYSSYYKLEFVYCPDNVVTGNLMEEAVERFKNYTSYAGDVIAEIKGMPTESDLEKYCSFRVQNESRLQMMGTVFRGLDTKDGGMSNSLDYSIRYGSQYSSSFQTNRKYRTYGPVSSTEYRETAFLSWQTALEETFIDMKAKSKGQSVDYKVSMQRFPYPEHVSASFSYLTMVPYLITYSYFIFIINMIRRLIEEKSNGSKELLKMMGMSDFVYWTSTFINYFIVAFVTMLIITIVYKAPLQNSCVFLKNTDFGILFLMMMLYLTQLILFGMVFSIFFNKGIFAIIVYIIYHDVSFGLIGVFLFIGDNVNLNYMPLTMSQKSSIILLPEGALQTMFYFLSFYDQMEKGISWSNVHEYFATPDLNVAVVLGMSFTACLLYVFMIWYFDAVWPWQPGVPKPFYFMFTKSYWNLVEPVKQNDSIVLKEEQNVEFFEAEPRGITAGVAIKNLSKEFRTGLQTKLAVNDVSLNIYQGQITALLGHNGAGKTTTINILTGLYTPTRGTASINGLDILRNTTKARRGLGVCPQHNVLFDTLTPEEHLKLYAALKGVPWSELGTEAAKTLALLRLTDKRNELVKTLSGGMKRKLSLGIAVIGGSKVLFLDEPTSGMDVEARRGVWDTLKEIRPGRTIILTTHYMEEADILGDRIAIMAEGEIQCCGSSMFLKQKLGTGYHLHVVKGETFALRTLTEFLERHIPGANVESENKSEVNFKLASSTGSDFGRMFEEMEQEKIKLGIESYGITITTMEDVFLNVANIADMKYKMQADDNGGVNGANGHLNDVLEASRQHRVPVAASTLLLQRIHALLLKRFHYARRHWSILLAQLLLPFAIICICLGIINYAGAPGNNYESLKLDLNGVYGNTEGFYNARNPEAANLAQSIHNVLEDNKVNAHDISDPTPYILKYGKKDMSKYWMKLLVGGLADVFPKNQTRNLTAWYNGEPFHVLPISLNLMHNAILKTVESSASITLTNAPLPPPTRNYYSGNDGTLERAMASVFVPLALAFLSASYVILPIHERVSKAKLLQLMSGIPTVLYWITMFLWDYLVHFIISIMLIIPFAIFGHRVFFSPHSEAIGSSILLMLLYGWASIPFSYLLSLIFKKGNVGFSVNISISAIFGVAAVSILSATNLLSQDTPYKVVDVFIWIFRFLPPFSVSAGFSNLFGLAYSNAFCGSLSKDELDNTCHSSSTSSWNPYYKCCPNLCKDDCLKEVSPFIWEKKGCGRDMFALAFDGALYFALLIFLERTLMSRFSRFLGQQFRQLRKKTPNVIVDMNNPEDTDVIREKENIRNQFAVRADAGNEALVSLNLSKSFKNFYAVDHLTFGIHKEECFGLLGVNGAGKTTTFRMLTGDCFPGEGNAFIQTYSLTSNLQKFQSFLGYCPQFDALIDRLTGREMLTLFARLRGLTGYDLEKQVKAMIQLTDLSKHADKESRFYSGGNKRKLSIGVALIGFPPLILLDEPTAGVDPVSRRKIWNVLSKARNDAGSAVLLTTHSMEETEALCSRLAIMVNGQFRCLGSIQHLKSKYGQGYTLKIKTRREIQDNPQAISDIKAYVQNGMRGAELKDEHQGMLQYQVTDPTVKLSHLFKFMSEMKSQFNLEDYLISETTLEQIFLTFARSQRITAENK